MSNFQVNYQLSILNWYSPGNWTFRVPCWIFSSHFPLSPLSFTQFHSCGLRLPKILPQPHQCKRRNKVHSRKDFFNKVEDTAKCALPSSKHAEENKCRYRSPNQISQFTQNGNAVRSVPNKVHRYTKNQGCRFLLIIHFWFLVLPTGRQVVL